MQSGTTLTLRALFAPDGSILPCTDKSKLIHYLEKMGKNKETHENAQTPAYEEHVDEAETSSAPSKSPQIVIVGGMVLVQQMANKPGTISTVKYIGQHFNARVLVLKQLLTWLFWYLTPIKLTR